MKERGYGPLDLSHLEMSIRDGTVRMDARTYALRENMRRRLAQHAVELLERYIEGFYDPSWPYSHDKRRTIGMIRAMVEAVYRSETEAYI